MNFKFLKYGAAFKQIFLKNQAYFVILGEKYGFGQI
jgi:hypothetical protein